MVGRPLGPMGFGLLFFGLVLHALTLDVVYGEKCNLPFDLDDQASLASAGGTVKEPVVADISVPDQKLALAGRLWLQLNGSCPSTADELAALLPGAKLVSIPGSSQVLLYPQHIRAQVRGFVDEDVPASPFRRGVLDIGDVFLPPGQCRFLTCSGLCPGGGCGRCRRCRRQCPAEHHVCSLADKNQREFRIYISGTAACCKYRQRHCAGFE